MTVHNHGPEEGVGLACNESRLPDGSLQGVCLMQNGKSKEPKVLLADGRWVPKKCLDALDELDKRWPGATFSGARAMIAAEVLASIGYYDED
jgi:hypothetical protein